MLNTGFQKFQKELLEPHFSAKNGVSKVPKRTFGTLFWCVKLKFFKLLELLSRKSVLKVPKRTVGTLLMLVFKESARRKHILAHSRSVLRGTLESYLPQKSPKFFAARYAGRQK